MPEDPVIKLAEGLMIPSAEIIVKLSLKLIEFKRTNIWTAVMVCVRGSVTSKVADWVPPSLSKKKEGRAPWGLGVKAENDDEKSISLTATIPGVDDPVAVTERVAEPDVPLNSPFVEVSKKLITVAPCKTDTVPANNIPNVYIFIR